MTFRIALIAAAGLLATTTAAHAAPHELSAFVKDYDVNHDGEVTRAEFDAGRAARFAATDTNGDGGISEEEYVAEYSTRLDARLDQATNLTEDKAVVRQREIRQTHVRFGVLDKDKDGKISKAEYDASGARAFAEQDKNKDGKISDADGTPPPI